MKLNGQQYKNLVKALCKGFPDLFAFEKFLKFGLNKNLAEIAIANKLEDIAFLVVRTAESQGWLKDLIVSARTENPGNAEIFAFCQEMGMTSVNLSSSNLEGLVKTRLNFQDVQLWREKMAIVERQVCRVENTNGIAYGTGFLISPDVIMTNYHVMLDVLRNVIKPEEIRFRFDFKVLANGENINQGKIYQLALPDWKIDASPFHESDNVDAEVLMGPAEDELDYILLKVAGLPGNEVISESGINREWIKIDLYKDYEVEYLPESPVLIMQHPEGQALKLAIDTNGIIGFNDNKTRIRYNTNTEKGSSGSPCFNQGFDFIALHNSGSKKFNRGVPINAILKLWEKRGILSKINLG